jgi:hypothetical protein
MFVPLPSLKPKKNTAILGFVKLENSFVTPMLGPEPPTTVALMGDSVLDNFHWLDDKSQDVRKQLEEELQKVSYKGCNGHLPEKP